jgi:hypothetical protein
MCNDTYQINHEEKKLSNEKKEFNGESWFVYEVYREETKFLKMCTFKAVLYINNDKKQLVLAFKGLDAEFEDIFNDEGALNNNINGVLLNGVIPQLITCYDVVEKANEIANEKEYTISFTGFSNGAWLAEYAIYYTHRYLKCKKSLLKAVLFDSPGIIKCIEETETNIINNQETYDIYDIADNITSYLSNPNFSNSCNKHIGNTYRVFIDYDETTNKNFEKENGFVEKLIEYFAKIFKKIGKTLQKINEIKDMIKKSKFFIKGLYSMFNHEMIKKFIQEFDVETGKQIKSPGEFSVLENRPKPLAEPGDFEFDYDTFNINDAYSDVERLEKIGTGKIKDVKKIEQRAKGRKMVEESPYEDIMNRYPDPIEPDIDYANGGLASFANGGLTGLALHNMAKGE